MNERTTAARAPTRTQGDEPGDGEAADVPLQGRVGRYVLLEQVGRGGMGAVYRAYDPKLRREIALKMVRGRSRFGGGEAEARLMREAQALARLNHPNVVAIYDAEASAEGVRIAMEFVEGHTMRTWLDTRRRTWAEVLEVGLAVGRGLAAAHAAGVIHRDVKPENVLVGQDPADPTKLRVRLTDFGLASEDEDATAADVDAGLMPLTRAGTILGTPPYVAPEQHKGDPSDTRSDQYGLCVTLWEALHGARPFGGDGWAELEAAKCKGPPSRPTTFVPKWLHALIARGLAVAPPERWPTTAALVEAMASGRSRARRRSALLGLGGLTTMAMGTIAWNHWDRSVRVERCEQQGPEGALEWNDGARTKLQEAFLGTNVGYAGATLARALPELDAYARGWAAARSEACVRAEVERAWSPEIFARSQWCLDERRQQFHSLLAELGTADRRAVGEAVDAVAALERVDPCLDPALLARLPAPPAEREEDIRAVRAQLWRAAALEATGAYDEGLAVARDALLTAQSLAWPPLTASARLRVGRLLGEAGRYAEAESTLEESFFEAAMIGANQVAFEAALTLTLTVGNKAARYHEGERWAKLARLVGVSLADPAGLLEAHRLAHLGLVRSAQGAYPEAAALQEKALRIFEAALGPDHPTVAKNLDNLAQARLGDGDHDGANRLFERSLRLGEEALGPEHPRVATRLSNLAAARLRIGEWTDAVALLERAFRIRETALGEDHPAVGVTLTNLGGVHYEAGDYAAAAECLERALQLIEKALGPMHPSLALTLTNLSNVRYAEERFDEAAALLERALAIHEQAEDSRHPEIVTTLQGLGTVHRARQDYTEAAARFEQALRVGESLLGRTHPSLAEPLSGLARVALARDQPDEAVEYAERALTLVEDKSVPASDLAAVRFVLACALVEAGGSSERAVHLAEAARDAFREAGDSRAAALAVVEAWLDQPPGPRRDGRCTGRSSGTECRW
jgi:tetratricopeptide (TPR) repeat protein/tRNA A-37 threonylcarbamoyl transferase component Bud32